MAMNRSIVAIVFLVFISVVLGLNQEAEAASMTFTTNTVISSNAVIGAGETWTVNSGVTVTINPGVTLTIAAGGILNIGAGSNPNFFPATINNFGTVNNSGTINNGPTNYGIIQNYGTINNFSTITNNSFPSTIFNHSGGTINNSGGTITNNAPATLQNLGTFTNTGTINIVGNGSNFNNLGGIINNNGGTITASTFGTITNTGTINNIGIITNLGRILNLGGIINNNVGGTINNNFGTILQNYGTVINSATMTNGGIFNTHCGGVFSGNPPSGNPVNILPCPTISINDVTQTEGNFGQTSFDFIVTRTVNTAAISVQFKTTDDTATSPSDYISLPLDTLNFGAGGPLTQTVTVDVNGDTDLEPDETFFVDLSNCIGCNIVDSQGIGTITNDDVSTLACGQGTIQQGNVCVVDPNLTVISEDTTLLASTTVQGDVLIQSNALFTIPAGVTLTVPEGHKILLKTGAALLVEDGGTVILASGQPVMFEQGSGFWVKSGGNLIVTV